MRSGEAGHRVDRQGAIHRQALEGGVIVEGGWRRPTWHRNGRGRGTARAAVRMGALVVDPWGPSRLRRWLHVTSARLAMAQPLVAPRTAEVPTVRAESPAPSIAHPELAGTLLAEVAGDGAA